MALISHPLDRLPPGATMHAVTAIPDRIDGKPSLRVELADAVTTQGTPGIDYVDMPTFVRIPTRLGTGTIDVSIWSRLNNKTSFDSRAFAGIAYRIADDLSSFEAVYLRPLNGLTLEPDPPRSQRAVQYFAYPDWKFDRLREQFPDGRFESAADIAPARWIDLRLTIAESSVTVFVDGGEVLHVDETRGQAGTGDVGLFVDIGTEAFFADLRIETEHWG